MKGDVIFSQSAWGRNEARSELNVSIEKAKASSTDVAIAYWHSQASKYELVGIAIDELLLYVGTLNPTHNGAEVRQALNELWYKYRPQLSDTTEKHIYRTVLANTVTFFKVSGGVGRKQLKEKILQELCNISEVYENS